MDSEGDSLSNTETTPCIWMWFTGFLSAISMHLYHSSSNVHYLGCVKLLLWVYVNFLQGCGYENMWYYVNSGPSIIQGFIQVKIDDHI
ncbi:hypothetical protein LAZ67_7001423 [Cordylochernes scorpioides]|uniref:Uncharacterized protein n=1 Tax=Cordylochernes scorpioides TaxID=51811 RepID=A0ABY6KMA8_9ARAC|nr:hypothetical protein LAZ67_7001423 [Cordylochernes scorpioides]